MDGDVSAGSITKVEMRGGQAQGAFENVVFNLGKAEIQLIHNVEFWVNKNKSNFTEFLIRSRIK